ncbi:anthranilate phosphoribosyltransferase [bacterium]|nr:anthranilate phosphoribosyltransferase [bacterium]
MTLKDYLKYVVHGGTLAVHDAERCCELLFKSEASQMDIAALLCAMHARGETVDELCGFLSTMRRHMSRVDGFEATAVDMCGTGGDGSHSFNLSTAASLVAAACGVTVAKHGNRAVSSKSGSADVIEALGLPFCESPAQAASLLGEHGFAFLFAPNFHPAMKSVAPVRRELGVRTIFNLLGPLANPAQVRRQIIGVYNPIWLRTVIETLARSGSDWVIACHSEGGLDEISLCGTTYYCMLKDGGISEGKWTPADWGLIPSQVEVVDGSSAANNAVRLRDIANGREPDLREWIVANCAPALWISGLAEDLRDAVVIARRCIVNGQFAEFLARVGCA